MQRHNHVGSLQGGGTPELPATQIRGAVDTSMRLSDLPAIGASPIENSWLPTMMVGADGRAALRILSGF